MRAASKEIETTYNELEATTRTLAEEIRQLGQAMREQGIQRELDRVAETLVQADKEIHQELLAIGVDLRQRAADIDSAVTGARSDLAATTGELGDGKYGRDLNR
jgi:hypothetical protein